MGESTMPNILRLAPFEMDVDVEEESESELESETDDGMSDPSSDENDDVEMHFLLRLDPAEDVYDDNDDGAKRRCRRTKQQPFKWKSELDEDAGPAPLDFLPAREPGVHLNADEDYTPLQLFKLFFPEDAVETLCRNTNKQGARTVARGARYEWEDVEMADFYKFIGIICFMSLREFKDLGDYWSRNYLFNCPYPRLIMAMEKFRKIFWNLHMSDPDEDVENDAKTGTPSHDKLFRVKPLMDTVLTACKTFYQPRRNLSVEERRVLPEELTRRRRVIETRTFGLKMFVITDSTNGYTVNFSVYAGKSEFPDGHGLSYDSVMSLTNQGNLGSGYHLYMDGYFTSPKLFNDLYAANFGACGEYRESRKGCPRSKLNALTRDSPMGTIRWTRQGPLVYVKWMGRGRLSVCSSIHPAYTGDTVLRRVASQPQPIPCPKPVLEYKARCKDVENIGDNTVLYDIMRHKSVKWYKTAFVHLLDIAVTNAFVLHKELMQSMGEESVSYTDFIEELVEQLWGVSLRV